MAAPKGGKTAPITLPADQVADLASIGCTVEEIAAHFKCSATTINRNYGESLAIGRELCKASARRIIWGHFKQGHTLAMKHVILNILKEKLETIPDQKDLAANDLMDKLNAVSTDVILKLVKEHGEKVG